MPNKLDQVGTYRGEIVETALQLSKKGEFPMFVVTMMAQERYIEDASDLEYFMNVEVIKEAKPQWVDWTGYEETIRHYMVLFTPEIPGDAFSEDNATLNYKQLQVALDWDGSSFTELSNGHFNKAKVLFRVKENNQPEYGPVQVSWVDRFDAPPQRELSCVDDSVVATLNKRMRIAKKKAAPVAASAAVQTTKGAKRGPKPKTKPVVPPTPEAPTPPVAIAPTTKAPVVESCTKEEAWTNVYSQASSENPETIQDSWLAAVSEIEETKSVEEDAFSEADWATVQNIVLRDLGLAKV